MRNVLLVWEVDLNMKSLRACLSCAGTGYIDRADHDKINSEDIDRFSCNDCGGSGTMKLNKPTKRAKRLAKYLDNTLGWEIYGNDKLIRF